jgi:type IV fimbrial biogenesis protein FimT
MRSARGALGFSVIELMTTITIFALLLLFGLPQYSTYMQNQQIRSAADGVLAGLQFARAEAVSRNVLGGVQFRLSGNDWSVVLPVTAERTVAETLRTQPGKERTGAVAFAITPSGTTTIAFNGLGRVTAPAADVAIDLKTGSGSCMHEDSAASNRCLRVTVSQSGQVRMCDPAKSSGDPQAC